MEIILPFNSGAVVKIDYDNVGRVAHDTLILFPLVSSGEAGGKQLGLSAALSYPALVSVPPCQLTDLPWMPRLHHTGPPVIY